VPDPDQLYGRCESEMSPVNVSEPDSTCFGRPHAHHQELNNCSSNLWFHRWSVVVAVLLVVVGPTDKKHIARLMFIIVKAKVVQTQLIVQLALAGLSTFIDVCLV
jgi:hypothetical protein